jgi:hypothetical protein
VGAKSLRIFLKTKKYREKIAKLNLLIDVFRLSFLLWEKIVALFVRTVCLDFCYEKGNHIRQIEINNKSPLCKDFYEC